MSSWAADATTSGEASRVPVGRSLLEADFPFVQVSEVARRDRYSRDPVYAAHKWWARRPPAVIRALLIAASVSADTSPTQFWERFRSSGALLTGFHVGDPFSGGATTLVEAARLGAAVTGTDVDPLAVEIGRHELDGVDHDEFGRLAGLLLEGLCENLSHLFPEADEEHQPLHYFWLREVACPSCSHVSLIHRNIVLARDAGRAGAVVRDAAVNAFCPECREIHVLKRGRTELQCCRRRFPLHMP
jgi:adenine-specific DNA methylase